MRQASLWCLATSVVMFSLGCKPSDPVADAKVNRAKDEIKRAAAATADAAAAMRN